MTFLRDFILCFIPLFAAVDPLGVLPVFLSVTDKLQPANRRKIILQAVPAALVIGAVFFLVGKPLLRFLNVQASDLRMAGGAFLFVYALVDLLKAGKPSVQEEYSVGIVPLATPLIVGPAVLTMGLVLVGTYGYVPAISALAVNLAILLVMLLGLEKIMRFIPMNTMRALSKVIDLLLGAIGVALIRQGVMAVITGLGT